MNLKQELAADTANTLHTRNLICLDETGSTNEDLAQMAAQGCPEWTIVTAEMQTDGKGRRGRSWHSPKGTSLSFSLLLRPAFSPDKASMLTLLMAMAVWDGIKGLCGEDTHFEERIKIKWPNDIVIDKKKVCGILTGMRVEGTQIDNVIIGVGININQDAFPDEIKDMATSLNLALGMKCQKAMLLERITEAFQSYYETFLQEENLLFLKDAYERRLINRGEEVQVLDPQNPYTGIAVGITEQGELLVEDESKNIRTVYAGEVSVRGLYGYV